MDNYCGHPATDCLYNEEFKNLESKYQQLKNASEKLVECLEDIQMPSHPQNANVDTAFNNSIAAEAIAQYKNETTETNKKEK